MNFPAVNFVLKDPKKEADHICFLAKNICDHHYDRGDFFVLPKPENNPHVVYFPNLKYSSQFWHTISSCKTRHFGQTFPSLASNEVISKINHQETLRDFTRKSATITWWKNNEAKFFSIFSEFLDIGHTLDKVQSIDVLLSNYGTRGSYHLSHSGKQISLSHRTDLPPECLVKTILLALIAFKTNVRAEIGNLSWKYKQTLVDFLLSETVFNTLLTKGHKPTSTATKNSHSLENRSQTYLQSLGFAPINILSLGSNQNILIYNQPIDRLFTPQESQLLKLFINNPGATLSFDKIAKTLWPENHLEKFSLYSITKVIENLRKKIRLQGVNKEVILAVRSEGYFLRS